MAIQSVEIGLVSASDALVDFYVAALREVRLDTRDFGFAVLHRVQCGPGMLKVMVPKAPPARPTPADEPWDIAGLRYLTFWVDDLDPLVEQWTAAGGTVRTPATEIRPGVRLAVVLDPDANVVEVLEQRP